MSIYRPKRSPFWHYDFRIDRYRFSGSTKLRNEDDAARFEEARKVDAQIIVDRIRAAGAEPLTLKAACDRWWNTYPVGRSKSPGYGHLKLPHLMIAVSAAEQQ
ncbi:hypothetical protein ACVIU4_004922 [Bradyrhizobium barranii subsp. barranii]